MTRRFPFLLALILVSLCHARCKARSAPGGASLTFGGSEVTVEGTLVEARGYFATKEVGGDRAFAPFLETLAGQAPQVLAQVLRTHLSMLGARGTREPWVRRLFRDHYRFRTVVGEECTWEQLVRQASPPAEEDDDARRVLHVYSDIALPPELLGMAGNLGVTIVLAEPAERALLEAIAADEGVRITGVSELVAGISGDVPPSFLQLRARMAVHIRRRGVDRIEFFHVAADVAPPAMFRVGLADEPGRRGAEARHPRDGGVVVYPEALLLNLGHPLLEELARRVGDLPPDLVRRAAEHLFCIATLKAPFEQTKCAVADPIIDSLARDLLRELGALSPVLPTQGDARCFVALPYAPEFDPVWQTVRDTLGADPYRWTVVRADLAARDLELLGSLMASIERSRRFVADISGDNPNVLLELGMMLQKDPDSTLILCDREVAEALPANLRGRLCCIYDAADRRRPEALAAWFRKELVKYPAFASMTAP